MRIILASASPRRRSLLAQIGLEFETVKSDVEEKVSKALPCEVVQELAEQKAQAVLEMVLGEQPDREADLLVIGADTVVACGGRILGKPVDREDAKHMLRLLGGKSHRVYTGVVLLRYQTKSGLQKRSFCEATTVRFAPLSEAEIEDYVSTKDPMDKAGAYGIQGFCARYIIGIEGDYNNVVGLPVARLYQEAKDWLE